MDDLNFDPLVFPISILVFKAILNVSSLGPDITPSMYFPVVAVPIDSPSYDHHIRLAPNGSRLFYQAIGQFYSHKVI